MCLELLQLQVYAELWSLQERGSAAERVQVSEAKQRPRLKKNKINKWIKIWSCFWLIIVHVGIGIIFCCCFVCGFPYFFSAFYDWFFFLCLSAALFSSYFLFWVKAVPDALCSVRSLLCGKCIHDSRLLGFYYSISWWLHHIILFSGYNFTHLPAHVQEF